MLWPLFRTFLRIRLAEPRKGSGDDEGICKPTKNPEISGTIDEGAVRLTVLLATAVMFAMAVGVAPREMPAKPEQMTAAS